MDAILERDIEISAGQAHLLVAEGPEALLIDIRQEEETVAGAPAGAQHIPRDFLEIELDRRQVGRGQPILLICAGGTRSLYAAQALRAFGYAKALSVKGGFRAWRNAGLPEYRPPVLTPAQKERFVRQISLPDMGPRGQAALGQARVTIIGAGGLGSPAILYLAAMGVGSLRIVDDDVVDVTNLQRQVVHGEADVGGAKTDSAARTVQALNQACRVETLRQRLTEENADAVIAGSNVVVNGADNYKARYILNDACIRAGIPMVDASVLDMEGQVSVFCGGHDTPCYRCLYPSPPPAELAPSCVAGGVLGVVPGIMGLLQALEAVKLIAGFGTPLYGRLLSFNALTSEFTTFRFGRTPECTCRAGHVQADGA